MNRLRKTILLSIVSVLMLTYSMPAMAQKVSVNFKNTPLPQVFEELQKQSKTSFIYKTEEIEKTQPVSLVMSGKLEDVLDKIITSPLCYEMKGPLVIIMLAAQNEKQAGGDSDKTVISGRVLSTSGEPQTGVSVWVKDSPIYTITGSDGSYSLSFSGNYGYICFSMIGYKQQELQIHKGSQILNVVLEDDTATLDEAVAIGYGHQKKTSIVGAIATVDPEVLKVPATTLSNVLAGRLSGVVSVQRSGEPGAGSNFWIRGISTFGANSNPLVLVDGIERSLDLVDVEDVKEFSVLKDAAATAVYGVRGANGVVLITTRDGDIGKPKVNIKVQSGVVTPTRISKVVDAETFCRLYNEAAGYEYFSQEYINKTLSGEDPDLYPNVDWINSMFNDCCNETRVNFNVSGGTSTVKYFISAGYYYENSLLKNYNVNPYSTGISYNKFNFRANVDVKITPRTSLNVILANTFENKHTGGTTASNIYAHAMQTPAISWPMVYSNGYLPGPGGGNAGDNPYSLLTQMGYKDNFYNNAQSVATLTHNFDYVVPGLTLNIKGSFDANNSATQARTRTPEQWFNPSRDAQGNLVLTNIVPGTKELSFSYSNAGWRAYYFEANVNYAQSFGKHSIGALLLYQMSQKNYVGASATTSQAAIPYRHQGLAARLTYNYDSRYFIEFNAGYNGSENFAPGHRFGFFPSVALGWLASEEAFWSDIKKYVNKFKIKGSYGLVGNDQIGGGRRFIYLETISAGGGYWFGENVASYSSLRLGDQPNTDVSWEKSRKLDTGFELGIFNKLEFQFDYFYEYRDNIFLQRASIPQYVGITSIPWVNIGKMRNSGVDMSATYNQQIGSVTLSGLANFTFARNVILDMDQPSYADAYRNRTGQARWETFGYISDGLFKDEEDIATSPDQSYFGVQRPGDIKYRDLNGDGVINEKDEKALGVTGVPEIVYGFGLSAKWHGFDLSVFFQGTGNIKIPTQCTLTMGFTHESMYLSNIYQDVADNHWTPTNLNAKYPRLSIGTNTNNSVMSDFWIADGSYLRFKNAEFGYSLPTNIVKKARMTGVRFYVSGTNLLTFSSFKLWDPDSNQSGYTYPQSRVVNFGIDINF